MTENINYESELNYLFLDKLKEKFSIEQDDVCVRYFVLRFMIAYYGDKDLKYNRLRKLAVFLLEELNIPIFDNTYTIYKGTKVPIAYAGGQSVENIIIDWEFRASIYDIKDEKGNVFEYADYLDKKWNEIKRYGENRAKKYKNTLYYLSFVKKNCLEMLNSLYGVEANSTSQLEGFEYPDNHNIFKRNMEEIYEMEVHPIKLRDYKTRSITENDLEKYLKSNLDLIEEGLKYVGSQVAIDNGRIDILARDVQNNYVIIELKVNEDKELIWQSLYYPMKLKEKERVNSVRMITLAPEYPSHIYQPLKSIDGVEVMQYVPLVELGKIKELKIYKI